LTQRERENEMEPNAESKRIISMEEVVPPIVSRSTAGTILNESAVTGAPLTVTRGAAAMPELDERSRTFPSVPNAARTTYLPSGTPVNVYGLFPTPWTESPGADCRGRG